MLYWGTHSKILRPSCLRRLLRLRLLANLLTSFLSRRVVNIATKSEGIISVLVQNIKLF
jgi:hypothetical protein